VRRIGVAVSALTVMFGLAGGVTATTAAADESPLQVTVAYDKATYNSDETLSVTLTITNTSDQDVTSVLVSNQAQCVARVFGWPKIGFNMTIPAHGTVSDTETGGNPLDAGQAGTVTCAGTVSGNSGAPGSSPVAFSTTATVVQVFGDYNGVLYRDRDHDGRFEAGEGIGGIAVEYLVVGAQNPVFRSVTSGPDGRFTLAHLPAGTYGVSFSSHRDWVLTDPNFGFNEGEIVVTQAAQPTAFLPVIPPLSDRLKATFGFDQATYQPGDTTHLTVTLTNTSNKAITGVIADCNRIGDVNGLFSFDGWGDLSGNGPGATIPAGTTVTFHIDQPLPAAAQRVGYVEAPCVFGPEPGGNPQVGFPGGEPRAKVPGSTDDTVVQFVRSDDDTVPVVGLKVRIVDDISRQPVITAKTDARGEISLPALPAGQYRLHLLGGFQILAGLGNVMSVFNPSSADQPQSYEVVPPAN
jgi:copper(I)-binding protein